MMDYEYQWQQLKAWLSSEMEHSKNWVIGNGMLSGEQLLRAHERIMNYAHVKAHMETIETSNPTTPQAEGE